MTLRSEITGQDTMSALAQLTAKCKEQKATITRLEARLRGYDGDRNDEREGGRKR